MDRFWRRISKREDDCWEWIGRIDKKGYGRTDLMGEHNGFAHRLAYRILVGELEPGTEFDHICHTQALNAGLCDGGNACRHRRCVNPAHLECVTHTTNVRRGNSVATFNARKTHCPLGHSYTSVRNERGKPKRVCLTCRVHKQAEYRADPAHREAARQRTRAWRTAHSP